jgi:hypothetical protein
MDIVCLEIRVIGINTLLTHTHTLVFRKLTNELLTHEKDNKFSISLSSSTDGVVALEMDL